MWTCLTPHIFMMLRGYCCVILVRRIFWPCKSPSMNGLFENLWALWLLTLIGVLMVYKGIYGLGCLMQLIKCILSDSMSCCVYHPLIRLAPYMRTITPRACGLLWPVRGGGMRHASPRLREFAILYFVNSSALLPTMFFLKLIVRMGLELVSSSSFGWPCTGRSSILMLS